MKIAVLGVGTAGLTSLAHCLAHLDESWTVYSISDPSTPILGIGESTTPMIPGQLFNGTRFTLMQDSDELDATVKYGVKYVGWRKKDFFSNILPPNHAIHFNNFKLKEFCFNRFVSLWQDKFQTIYGNISNVVNDKNNVAVTVDTVTHYFDYVIDCRGYPEDYSDYVVSNAIPVNHCLVHTVPEPGTWTWTYHVAHRNGWMFGIPLKTRQGWGYLYNDTITEREEAIDDIAQRFRMSPYDLKLREFKFKTYYAKKFIDGRIVKNGNRALFFEPMEALSGNFYGTLMRSFLSYLDGTIDEYHFNTSLTHEAQDIENFICFMYHGGSTYDSKFWNITKEKCRAHLHKNERFDYFIDLMKTLKPHEYEFKMWTPFLSTNWVDFDSNLGYNYFNSNSLARP
jgi:hypothetical protein